MKKPQNNYAFIDGQNLNLSIQRLGWKLDFRKKMACISFVSDFRSKLEYDKNAR